MKQEYYFRGNELKYLEWLGTRILEFVLIWNLLNPGELAKVLSR
jgi:hypothetical protein